MACRAEVSARFTGDAGAGPAMLVRERREEVAELVALGAEVLPVLFVGWDLDGHALDEVQPVPLEPYDLLRVVGEETELPNAKIDEDLGADAVVAKIGLEPEALDGFHGVLSLILQLVRAQLVVQPDAAPLLSPVDVSAPAFLLPRGRRRIQRRGGVAPARPKQGAGKAVREHRDEDRLGAADVAHDERDVLASVHGRLVGDGHELAELRRQPGGGDATDQ